MTTEQAPRAWRIDEAEPTAETLAYHAQKIAEYRSQWPEVFDAPQPPKLPWVNGSFSLNMKEQFPEIAKTFRLRDPAVSTDGLIRTHIVGWCLSPILNPGDGFWIDPRAVPADGDIVLLCQPPEICQSITNWGKKIPAVRETYGPITGPFMMKMLKTMGRDWYYCTNTSANELRDRTRVCGVVRRIEPGAGPRGGVCAAAAGEA